VETKDEQHGVGRKIVSDSLTRAMTKRGANCGVYVSRNRDGLGKEIGEWAEGECQNGPYVATVDENLFTAIRFLLCQQRLTALKASRQEIDIEAVQPQLERIRTSFKHVGNINSKVTDIRKGAEYIQREGETLRDEVRDAVLAIEDCLRATASSSR